MPPNDDGEHQDPNLSLAELAAEANRRKGRLVVTSKAEGKPSVEHDARCDNQDAVLRALGVKVEDVTKAVHQDELRIERLFADMENLIGRVPEHLGADVATLTAQVNTVIRDLDELKKLIRSDFVTRAELDPIRRLVYGVVGLILAGVIGGLLGLVLIK